MAQIVPQPAVVKYLDTYFLHYNNTEQGLAKLLRSDLTKHSGTPELNKLTIIRKFLPYKHTNGCYYIATKQGVISLSTGNVIKDKGIINAVMSF